MRKVNRPAKVGEYIQIVNIDDGEERYKNGDILKVIEDSLYYDVGNVYVNTIDDPWLVLCDEYVVLEDYLERDDAVDSLRYCINDVLTCKTVGKNLLEQEPTPYEPYEPIYHINKNGSIMINEKEGMINMNQVLKLYIDKHSDEIIKKYNDLIEKDYEELEIVKEYKNLINEFEINLQLLFDREENQINNVFERIVTDNVYKYDLDEHRLKNEIAKKYIESREQEYKELNELVKEVEAQLSLSDDLEYQLDVLKRYDIINKKTNKVN